MPVTNREEFIEYCMRRLGAPVIQINVAPEQAEDRVDEALRYYKQYHYDGTERDILRVVADAKMVAKRAIQLPPNIHSVLNVVPTLHEFEAGLLGAPYPRDLNGHISLNTYYGSTGTGSGSFSMKGYAAYSIQLDVMSWLFRPERSIVFRRANNSVTFDVDVHMQVGDVFLLEVYAAVDENDHENIWEDLWLQEFGTCLIKLQWGSNLIKYSGVQLPTGITLDGQKIYDDAQAEREKLLERLNNEFSYPLDFFMG